MNKRGKIHTHLDKYPNYPRVRGIGFLTDKTNGIQFRRAAVDGLYTFLDKPILVSDGSVMVTDPCYEPGTWCHYKMEGMLNGQYFYGVDIIDDRPLLSFIVHREYYFGVNEGSSSPLGDLPPIQVLDANIGVDSGQAGFFAYDKWQAMHDAVGFDAFYDKVGELTLGEGSYRGDYNIAGVYEDWGACSFTAYGDGGYPLYKFEKDGQIVGLMLDFAGELDTDEEGEDE